MDHGLVAHHILVEDEGEEAECGADEGAPYLWRAPGVAARVMHTEDEAAEERGDEDSAPEVEADDTLAELGVADYDGGAESERHDGYS